MGQYFARILADQQAPIRSYAEPYAGGAGAGLYLLTEGYIDHLYINDLNPGIAAFWRSVLRNTDEFVDLVRREPISVGRWHEHRQTYLSGETSSELDLGFATFYLNRCNRSGILTARPIGGLDQTGRWKIDARFNREELCRRIQLIAEYRDSVTVTSLQALEFLRRRSRSKKLTFCYVDPPYLNKGEDLYMSMQSWNDHEALSKCLSRLQHPWVLTYDVEERIRALYPLQRCLRYSISHTAQERRVGSEFMFFSRGLRVPDLRVASNREASWVA